MGKAERFCADGITVKPLAIVANFCLGKDHANLHGALLPPRMGDCPSVVGVQPSGVVLANLAYDRANRTADCGPRETAVDFEGQAFKVGAVHRGAILPEE
jgi:hypothetical protein